MAALPRTHSRTLPSLAALVLLLLAACSHSSSEGELAKRCQRAVAKVLLDDFVNAPDFPGKPSAGEKAIMDGARTMSQATCEREGLTEEQAACFNSIKDIETLFLAADCPAIAANKPSWFLVPPPEARHQALESMKAKRATE